MAVAYLLLLGVNPARHEHAASYSGGQEGGDRRDHRPHSEKQQRGRTGEKGNMEVSNITSKNNEHAMGGGTSADLGHRELMCA